MSIQKMLSGMNISASGWLVSVRGWMSWPTTSPTPIPHPQQTAVLSATAGELRGRHGQLPGRERNAAEFAARSKGLGIKADNQPPRMVYQPGHPDADAEGFVAYPDIAIASEMVDLMTASRAYEANLKSLETFRELAEQALALMRGN